MFSDGVELWRRIRQLDADSADRHRRARTAAGIGIITFASAAVALVASIPAHGITLVTAMLVTVLVGQLLVIHLGRTNRPTAAGLVFTATVVLVPVVAVALTHRIDTWPLAVPATALVLTFLLPLRWTPLILTGGMAVLAVLSWQAATFDSPPVPLDQMLRDSAIILAATVAIAVYGATSMVSAQRERDRAHAAAQAATELATTDVLTGLRNRRVEQRELPLAVAHARGQGRLLAVAMIDLDGFKRVNDRLGHETGDDVLRQVSGTIAEVSRSTDTLVRHGGDEFLLAMPCATAREAQILCERIRAHVAGLDWKVDLRGVSAPTVSIGIADSSESEQWGDLVSKADSRLLRAKAAGRNRVIASDTD